MKIKKLANILAASTMIFSLCACSSSSDKSTATLDDNITIENAPFEFSSNSASQNYRDIGYYAPDKVPEDDHTYQLHIYTSTTDTQYLGQIYWSTDYQSDTKKYDEIVSKVKSIDESLILETFSKDEFTKKQQQTLVETMKLQNDDGSYLFRYTIQLSLLDTEKVNSDNYKAVLNYLGLAKAYNKEQHYFAYNKEYNQNEKDMIYSYILDELSGTPGKDDSFIGSNYNNN